MTAPPPPEANRLALDRTVFAADRTLMAWMRTSISLIGFGFTIFKFLQGVQGLRADGSRAIDRDPQTVGLVMIGLGLAALILSVGQYWQFMRGLGARPWRLSLGFALVFWVLGAIAFWHVLAG